MVQEVPEGHEAQVIPKEIEVVPPISESLVQWLERTFPPRCKNVTEPIEAHMHYAGHVALVVKLRQLRELQRDNSMTLTATDDGRIEVRPNTSRAPGHRPSIPRVRR